MEKILLMVAAAVFGFAIALLFAFIFAIITQWAWAGSVAQVFHLPELTFNQAFWLNVLGGMVFKSSSSVSSK